MKLNLRKGIFLTILTLSILTLFKLSPTLLALTVKDSGSSESGSSSMGSSPTINNHKSSEYHTHSYVSPIRVKNSWLPLALPSVWHNTNNYVGAPKPFLGPSGKKEPSSTYNITPTPSGTIFRENPHHYQSSGGAGSGHETPFHSSVSAASLSSSSSSQQSSSPEVESYNNKNKSPRETLRDPNDLDEIFQNDVEDISKLLRSTSSSAAQAALSLNHFKRSSYPNHHHIEYPNPQTAGSEEDSNIRRSNDITKRTRSYDVPQIECPEAEDGMERFACPTPDSVGRYRCVDDHVLCDGFVDCPNAEDEDRHSCLFYKTTKAHLDVLADALLRWARGKR